MPLSASDLRSALEPHFQSNFSERGELGASVSIWDAEGELLNLSHGVADLENGVPWGADTLVPVWSATKGPAAVACLLALEEAGLWLDDLVCDLWPAFGQNGKETISFRQILSHTAGLSALDRVIPVENDHEVFSVLETMKPVAAPGTQQAYHARTFGFLLDKIVQEAARTPSLGRFFRERLGAPMDLDFYIGLPVEQLPRVAILAPARVGVGRSMPQDDFMKAFNQPDSLTRRTFSSPSGLQSVRDMNRPETLALGLASFGGVGSASALAKFYSLLATGGIWKGETLLSPRILSALETTLSQAEDGVLCRPIAFGPGVMNDPVDDSGRKIRHIFGRSVRAFGHPGAGGSLAWGDPERGIGFAYVMNQMEFGALPNEKALGLVRALDAVW